MKKQKQETSTEHFFTVTYEPVKGGGYQVSVPVLPGLVSYGRDIEEAKEMARDAIRCYVEGLQKEDSWRKNIGDLAALVFSPYVEIDPKRSGFVPEKEGYKTEKDFRIPRGEENRIKISLLMNNQSIHSDSFEDISQLLL